MKRTLFCLLLGVGLAALVPLALAADETVDIWTQIYYDTKTDAGRYQIALKILDLHNKEFAPMLQAALDTLYYRRIDSGTVTERHDKLELARLLVQNLGKLNANDAIERIYSLYNELNDPFLKSDCAIALGRFRAKAYAYRFARDLSDQNLAAGAVDTRPQEVLAFGLVQALQSLRDPASFDALFLASVGWYPNNSHVKEIAKNALLDLFPDPSEQFATLVGGYPDNRIKVAGLEAEIASAAPATGKAAVARVALRLSLDMAPTQAPDLANQKRLRSLALQQLVATADKDAQSVALLVDLISRDKFNDQTMDDTIQAYTALGYNATPAAVTFLNSKLEAYNAYQRSGKNSVRDKVIVREVISAIKRARSPDSKAILFKSQYVEEYDNAIINDIKEALKLFP